MPRYILNRGDEVCVYFKTEDAAPYRLHGKYMNETDEYIRLKGTVGEGIGHDFFVPKSEVKCIERLNEGSFPE